MAIAVAQDNANGTTSSVASIAVVLASPVAVGSLLVASCHTWGASQPVGAVTDNQGNTWTQLAYQSRAEAQLAVFVAVAAAGSTTVTFTPSSSQRCAIQVTEITGAASTLIDSAAANDFGGNFSGNRVSSGSATAVGSCIAIGSMTAARDASSLYDSGDWTALVANNGFSFTYWSHYRLIGDAVSDLYEVDLSANTNWAAAIVMFAEGGASQSPVPIIMQVIH